MAAGRYAPREGTRGKWWVRDGHTATPSPEAKVEVGARVRAAREAQGLKARDLAELLGRHPSAISDIERGVGSFSLGYLLQVAEALDVDPGSLFPQAKHEGEYARGYRHGYLLAIERLQQEIPEG